MFIKKTVISALLGLTSIAFSGSEDWSGQYNFKSSNGESYSITHTPNHVQFMFFNVSGCLSLSKGSSINGMIIPADAKLCRIDNIETFTSEVQKLGLITNKVITIGPTYTN